MTKTITLAARNCDIPIINEIKDFEPSYSYTFSDSKNRHEREWGKIKLENLEIRVVCFEPEYLYDLKCIWENKVPQFDIESTIEKKVVVINSKEKRVYQQVIALLVEWALESHRNSFPANFKIWTGLHDGRDAIFCKIKAQDVENPKK